MLRKVGFATISLLIISFVFVVAGLTFWKSVSKAPGNDKTIQRFLITKGSSAEKIANDLKDQNLIKSPLAFKFYTQITGISDQIPPGEFKISGNLSLKEVVEMLLKGPVEVWVTVPEGLRREEIVERYIEGLGLGGTVADGFRADFLMQTRELEGYLYPDTYLFPLDITADKVVTKMRSTFDQKFTEKMRTDLVNKGRSIDQVVILASLLERETLTSEERPVVSGILFNRLENDWPLQVDASVQYAIASENCRLQNVDCDWWPKNLTKDDLAINSPFNTYKFSGIPPSPISSPGIISLTAVVYPEDTDYMYYIHDTDGVIHYAETLSEHNQNVSRYLKK